jgi:hypothetical protein
MPPETQANRDFEEQSIKARKHEVYEMEPQPVVGAVQKPFREYLRETPPAPLAPAVKIALWVVAVLVVLLFLASLVVPRSRPRRSQGSRASLGAPEGGPDETVWVAQREEVMRSVSTAPQVRPDRTSFLLRPHRPDNSVWATRRGARVGAEGTSEGWMVPPPGSLTCRNAPSSRIENHAALQEASAAICQRRMRTKEVIA